MIEFFKRLLRYKRIGLFFETMQLVIDEVTYSYDVAYKVKELNRFSNKSLVEINGVYSMDRKVLNEFMISNLLEKAPRVIDTKLVDWENDYNEKHQ